MVSFSCESCNDTLAKKKLDQHLNRCGGPFTCLDCNTTFHGTQYRAHTSCISEAQKYQGAMYRPEKQKGKGKNANVNAKPAPTPAEPEPVLLHAVKPTELTPAVTATNELLAIASGSKTLDPITITPTAEDTGAGKKEKRKQEKKERIKARKEKESSEPAEKKRKRDEAVEVSLEKLADDTAPIATPAEAVKELNGSQKKRQKKKENKLLGVGQVGSMKDDVKEDPVLDVQEVLVVKDVEMKDAALVEGEEKVAKIESTIIEKMEKSRKDRGKKDKKGKKEKTGKKEKLEVPAVVSAPSALDGLVDTPMTNGTDAPTKTVTETPKLTEPVVETQKPAETPISTEKSAQTSTKKDKKDKKPDFNGKNKNKTKVEKKKNGAVARKAQPKNRARDLLQSVPDKATSLTEVLRGMSSEEQAKILRNLMVTKKKTGRFVLKLADGE